MVRTIAPLVYSDKVDGTYIKIGTGSWQHWLSKNSRFRYESFWGFFTACKEYRGEEILWLAYRRDKDQLRQAYLGTSQDLTQENLLDTAKKLSATDTAPWECKLSHEPEAIPNTLETNAVSLWCIFYTHPDARVEFLGGCWDKEQALTQVQRFLKQANYSELVGDLLDGTCSRYQVREELVLPIGYKHQIGKPNSFDIEVANSKAELLRQVSELQSQVSELKKQVNRERQLNTNNNAAIKFIWN